MRLIDAAVLLESGKREKGGALHEGVPSLGGEHLRPDGTIDWSPEKMKYVSYDFYAGMRKGKLKQGDVLVVKDGATTGKTAFVDNLTCEAAINEHVFILRFASSLRARYVFYFLMSAFGQSKILEYFKGSAVGGIGRDFAEMDIAFHDDETTQKIIENLDAIRNQISLNSAYVAKLDELVKSRFVEMFGDPETNSMGWDVATLGELATDVRYGTSKAAGEEGEYVYLRMNNMTYEGELDLTDVKRITLDSKELEKCIVRKGDLLFNRTNSREHVGKTCVFQEDEPMVIAGYIIRVRLCDAVLPEYVSAFMNSRYAKKMLKEMAHGAVNQANINAKEMQSIALPVPPIGLQGEYLAFAQQVDKLKYGSRSDACPVGVKY